MTRSRWPLAAALAGVLVIAAAAWVGGRASAPAAPPGETPAASSGAVRMIDGISVGVEHSRDGALAASDNYVAQTTETVVQDPARFEQLVRRVYAPSYQAKALERGRRVREGSPEAVENYGAGGRGLALIAARRLDAYEATRAETTTWTAGFNWGPSQTPGQRWFLTETTLRWDGQRWLVERMDEAARPAPAPARVGYDDRSSLRSEAFERELRAMTAPTYGAGR